jgi:protein-L-isoaspartate(D-aspartate) O-methyltransferase
LTDPGWSGAFLLITRRAGETQRYPAKSVGRTGIIACIGGRDADAEARLKAALQRASFSAIQSLRRGPEAPDETCWLAGDGWWLSTAPVPGDTERRPS